MHERRLQVVEEEEEDLPAAKPKRRKDKLPEPDDQGKEVWALTHDVRAYGQSQPLVPTTASNNEVLELLRCPVLVIGAATKFCKPTTSCQPTADRLS